ncbi:12569_t:CDS:2 [Ambispora gerdemannii]|uniref:12569_t:CDS:1 n=1 Tax=Ambispora gerdemannii TaxID=144530 RepID=A0A9N9C0Q0_9GLOM|nr:12569_t:CDS:2 [Ambispora gerdemannii]
MSQISSESDKELQIENFSSENTSFTSPQLGIPENYPPRPHLLDACVVYSKRSHRNPCQWYRDSETYKISKYMLQKNSQNVRNGGIGATLGIVNTDPLVSNATRYLVDRATSSIKRASDSATEDSDSIEKVLNKNPTILSKAPSTSTSQDTLSEEDVDFIPLYNKISSAEARNDSSSQAVLKFYYDFGKG